MDKPITSRAKALAATAMLLAAAAGGSMRVPLLKRRIDDLRFKQADEDAIKAAQAKRERKQKKLLQTGL